MLASTLMPRNINKTSYAATRIDYFMTAITQNIMRG
jgi:hypothetical protein